MGERWRHNRATWTPQASCAAQADGGPLPGVVKVWREAGVWYHQEQGADSCCRTHSYLNQMLHLEAAISQAGISCSEMSASWNCATWFWSGNIPLLPMLLQLSQMKYLHDQNGSLAAAVSAKGPLHYSGMVHWQYLQPVLPTEFSSRQSTDPFSKCVNKGLLCLELLKVPE